MMWERLPTLDLRGRHTRPRGYGVTPSPSVSLRHAITFALVMLVPLATVGPNIGNQGLRVEHVYAVVVAVALLSIHGAPSRLASAYWIVVLAWAALFLVALLGGIVPVESSAASPNRAIVEGLGRLGVPLLGLIIGAYAGLAAPPSALGGGPRPRSPLEAMLTVLVVVACVNTIMAVASVDGEASWLALFRADPDETTVSDRAAQIGRFGGMVNQPFEAGLLYSIALVTVCRKWAMRILGSWGFVGLAALIGLGGAMSGSKVFYFGGVPIALAYLLLSTRPLRLHRLSVAGLAALASVLAAWWVLSEFNQRGLEGLRGLLPLWEMEEPRSSLFAGRFDSDGDTMELLRVLLKEVGAFGFGASGSVGAYDIGVMEFAAVGGWTGMAAMVLISVALLVASASQRHERYWLALSLLVVGANLGGPAFTANRNALVIWVLLGAMLQRNQSSHTHPCNDVIYEPSRTRSS